MTAGESASQLDRARVLVMDDEVIRDVVGGMLQYLGCACRSRRHRRGPLPCMPELAARRGV